MNIAKFTSISSIHAHAVPLPRRFLPACRLARDWNCTALHCMINACTSPVLPFAHFNEQNVPDTVLWISVNTFEQVWWYILYCTCT